MYTATGTLDTNARITTFAPLVRRMAHTLAARLPSSVQIDDIIQAGMMGLMDAAARFEESQGNQFETYATQRIRGAMLDELRGTDWMSRGGRRQQREIESAVHKLEQKLGVKAGGMPIGRTAASRPYAPRIARAVNSEFVARAVALPVAALSRRDSAACRRPYSILVRGLRVSASSAGAPRGSSQK